MPPAGEVAVLDGRVRIEEKVMQFPTYEAGEPGKNPMFLEKRVYQGSSGKVYPLPMTERIADEKKLKPWKVVELENEYLCVWVMPELGGRIQRAYDKTNGYDFVYYNHVIKPALVGLAGPWISGGIEFNWPQHHRPSTYLPVEHTIAEEADGSATVWLAETDRMYGTRATWGITLHPGRAYIEISARLYNGTAQPQNFLWWANPAYAVNENTQSVFPPDVHAVFDHGKRDVSTFPIATGTYYKVDYSKGVDISRYKNIPVPTSFMAYHSDYDFVGGYDAGRKAGLLHVADHHVSPGKKQWTWGCGDFGKAWDRNLTDADGPYVELMTGVYTDNQPDFTWIKPGEEKRFTQYFLPYKEVGAVKNATKDLLVNLETAAGQARVTVYASSEREGLRVRLKTAACSLLEETVHLSPVKVYAASVPLPGGVPESALTLTVTDRDGRELLRYRPEREQDEPAPQPARAIDVPEKLPDVESLYLAGLHLEQYRHATRSPEDYYREGLRRSPGDIRINNAYGRLLMRRGLFEEAERYFRRAIATATRHNPNPYNSEPYYNLGVCLKLLGRTDEAYDALYKACWSAEQCEAGYFALAEIDAARSDYTAALAHLEASLDHGRHSGRALGLKAAVLRRLRRAQEAFETARKALLYDVLDPMAAREAYLAAVSLRREDAAALRTRLEACTRLDERNVRELARAYAAAGLYDDAEELLAELIGSGSSAGPLVYYELGWFYARQGDAENAAACYAKGSKASPDYCFPNRLEDMLALTDALRVNPADAKAHYYLGNFWYDRRQYDRAAACFERSKELDDAFPTVHRNLALLYFNRQGRPEDARAEMERAFALDPSDARVFLELDQLYKKTNVPPAERLRRVDEQAALVKSRDDLYIEYITLLNLCGRAKEAAQRLAGRRFHPWEGGEGKATRQYTAAQFALGRDALHRGAYGEAVQALEKALVYPENLGEGKLAGAQENDLYYELGRAYRGLADGKRAEACFEKASSGLSEPASAMFYNDQPPETIFYQGLAQRALGREAQARATFEKLLRYGEKHLGEHVEIDYFAVSLPDFLIFDEDLDRKNNVHCHYLMGLGLMGLGRREEALREFDEGLRLDASHQGLIVHREICRAEAK